MTRDQIAADLLELVVRIGNELPPEGAHDPDVPPDVRAAEWAYVKGLASHAILQLRGHLVGIDRSLADLPAIATGRSRRV